jgi:2-methylisocitrate lyase-like PEP mutase family enzyme
MSERFRELHDGGFFVMPNPWDVGSALRLQRLGFVALATTSSGHAWSLGLEDQQLSFEQVLRHVSDLTAVLDVPLNVDSERIDAGP